MSEKKLLILGLLVSQEMHGYQLNDMLQHGPNGLVQMSKANAYKILKAMENEKWVSSHDEKEGNRPMRRVYALTEEGRHAFMSLLRDNLASFPTPEFPAVVGLDFMHVLPASEAADLLETRREAVAARFAEIDVYPEEARDSHLSLAYLHHFYKSEQAWLSTVIARLQQD